MLPGTIAYSPPVGHFQLLVDHDQPHLQETHVRETYALHVSLESSLSSSASFCISQLPSSWSFYLLVYWADVFIASLVDFAHSSIQTFCRPRRGLVRVEDSQSVISPMLRILPLGLFSIFLIPDRPYLRDQIRHHFLH